MRIPIRGGLLVAGVALSGLTGWLVVRSGGPGADERARALGAGVEARVPQAHDSPDAAWAYEREKRLRPGSGVETAAAYRVAEARLAALPRFSTRLGRPLTAGAEAMCPPGGFSAAAPELATWTPVGPGNIGGRTRVLAIDPRDPERMIAAGVSGGLWKTVDGGASWRPVGDHLANIAVNSLAVDPRDPDVLYAGTGEGYFREVVRGTWLPLRGAGIFGSRDGGESWHFMPGTAGPDFYWVNDLVVSPHDSRRIYAATRTGVWRSPDGGESWQRVLDPGTNGGCLDLAVRTDTPQDAMFAACGTLGQATVLRNPAAETSTPWSAVLSEPGMGRTSLAIAPSNQNVVYALSASNVGGPGGTYNQGLFAVFRSTAGGAAGTWSARLRNTSANRLATLLLTNPITAAYTDCHWAASNDWVTMGWYVNVIAVDPVDPNRLWAAGVDLFRSDDGGASWGVGSYWWASPAAPSYVHADQHGIVFHPSYDGTTNRTLFVVNDGGVFRTDDATAAVGMSLADLCNPARTGLRWVALNHGYGVTQFYHGALMPDGRSYLGGTQDNGTIAGSDADGPDGWRAILGGDGGYVAVDPRDNGVVYAESQWFGFARSSDGGSHFGDATTGVTDPPSSFLFVTPFLIDPNAPDRLWAGGRRVWRTDDGALGWSAASAPLGDGGRVSAIAVAPGRADRVLVGTSSGTIYRTDAATTADGSAVWEPALPRAGFVSSLAFDPTDADVAYATYADFGGRHVWRSADAGASWTAIDGDGPTGIPDIPVHVLAVDPDGPRRLFIGTDLGVLTSVTGGTFWAVENTGFATAVTESLAIGRDPDGSGPVLYAFTHGRGAWRVALRGAGQPPFPRPPRRHLAP